MFSWNSSESLLEDIAYLRHENFQLKESRERFYTALINSCKYLQDRFPSASAMSNMTLAEVDAFLKNVQDNEIK
jgi:hypothetical protein